MSKPDYGRPDSPQWKDLPVYNLPHTGIGSALLALAAVTSIGVGTLLRFIGRRIK